MHPSQNNNNSESMLRFRDEKLSFYCIGEDKVGLEILF
jgi:hypothetical protein